MHPANHVEISGGLKDQRLLVNDVIEHCVDNLIPRVRTLWIEVLLDNYEESDNVYGFCSHLERNQFLVELDKQQNIYNLILTTCHEMAHVKQGVRGEDMSETDAWKLQCKLAHAYIKDKMGMKIKDLKLIETRI